MGKVTVNVNKISLVHKGSGGVATSAPPDVCKTPPVPVPVPYTNVAFSNTLSKGTKTITVDGGNSASIDGSEFSSSIGDEAGAAGGVASGVNTKEATWITSSPDVFMEGKAATRLTDKMLMNKENTMCAGEVQEPVAPAEDKKEEKEEEKKEESKALDGFDKKTKDLAKKSPELQKQLKELEKDGWTIKHGKEGGGSYANRQTKTITIAKGQTPEQEVTTVAHEAGHARYGTPPRHGMDGASSRSDYISRNVDEHMRDEAAAQFNSAQVRDEILGAGGSDIGIPGRGDYEGIWDRYDAGDITRDQALGEMAGAMGAERTSTTGANYRDYYGGSYGRTWDNAHSTRSGGSR